MAKWSVALFGHYKPNYYLLNNSGQIVSTFVEEPEVFDPEKLTLYKVTGVERRAVPGDVVAFRPFSDADKWTPVERRRFLIIALEGLDENQMLSLCEPYFDIATYPSVHGLKVGEPVFPQQHRKKRRFNLELEDLSTIGVNTDRMLDVNDLYVPAVSIQGREICHDKKKQRKVLGEDGLRLIEPVIITQEMKGIVNG